MRIALGSDHGGFELKGALFFYLRELGHELSDLGCFSKDSTDYPDYGFAVGESVVGGRADVGIVICTSGIGISIAANKVPGVRCALCDSARLATLARAHNNSNVLAMGAAFVDVPQAKEIVHAFLQTPFEGGRHERRVNKLDNYGG